jgi:outer membrane protein, multidrug efflux system
MSRPILRAVAIGLFLLGSPKAQAQSEPAPPTSTAAPAETVVIERVTFDEAVRRAAEHNPTVMQAAQAILRAQALLDQSKSVFLPSVYGGAGRTILDSARGFSGNVTQPRMQWTFNATASFRFLDLERWAEKTQAADQVAIARISAEETRRQVTQNAAQSYLAVIASERQREIAVRNRDTAQALADYASARLDAGKGSRLNQVRSFQEVASAESVVQSAELLVRQAQEALGVAVFADGPLDANGDPDLKPAVPSSNDAWLHERPDVRLFAAELSAADRVLSDSWKSWLPTGTASFTPQYVTPKGFFEPAKTWRAVFQLQVPIFDGTLGATRRLRMADRETAHFRLDAVKVEARAELRVAQEAVARVERIVESSRQAAMNAVEALKITRIAYEAGATNNIEVVEAQQTARNLEVTAALAEHRLRQARLDLLVALGQFPQ